MPPEARRRQRAVEQPREGIRAKPFEEIEQVAVGEEIA
jgi:hypothetical protein